MKPTMAATSAVRGSSRSPPFVVVGLIVVLCILSFYYWRVSSHNSELEFQIAELRSVVRDELSKRGNAERRSETLIANLKGCEDAMEKDKSLIVEKESNIQSLNKQIQAKTDEVDKKQVEKIECDTNLRKCQDDTNGIRQELGTLKEESAKRDQELKALKEAAAATMDKKCDCTTALLEQRKTIENILLKAVGPQALQALNQNGIGKPEDVLAQGAQGDNKQAPAKDVAKDQANPQAASESAKGETQAGADANAAQDTPGGAGGKKEGDGEAGNAKPGSEKRGDAADTDAEADPDADGDVVGKVGMDDLDTADIAKSAPERDYDDYVYSEDEYADDDDDAGDAHNSQKVIDEARGDGVDIPLNAEQEEQRPKQIDGNEQMEQDLQRDQAA